CSPRLPFGPLVLFSYGVVIGSHFDPPHRNAPARDNRRDVRQSSLALRATVPIGQHHEAQARIVGLSCRLNLAGVGLRWVFLGNTESATSATPDGTGQVISIWVTTKSRRRPSVISHRWWPAGRL